MKRLLLRSLPIAVPVLSIVASYFITDPFRVLRTYRDPTKNCVVSLNKDHIGTTAYLTLKDSMHYDAFLFGSSRTMAFRFTDWRTYLPAEAVPFAFDANKESLFGIRGKVRLIRSTGGRIAHALLLICPLHTFAPMKNSSDALYIKDPRVSGESRYAFHKTMLSAYFSNLFFVKYLDHRLTGRKRPYMLDVLTFTNSHSFDPISMERGIPVETIIEADPERYYRENADLFPERAATAVQSYPAMIAPEHVHALREVRGAFDRDGTRYAIVISPLYDQKRIDAKDLAVLRAIFGAEHVFDHSGVNEYTSDVHNYFESSHFRPSVGRRILEEIHAVGPRTGPAMVQQSVDSNAMVPRASER
ncbi:MAG: hypothetical protein IT227_07045 [Flavobacteriales bacterium]|nr:hypothetical protein [Flavobacteriales bacterium]